jgi:hypothetical protein
MSDEVVQIWVRNDKGQVYGPLTPTSVELLLDNGVLTGKVQASLDGNNYVYPGRMPGIRMVFPKELWGEAVLPHTELDDAWSHVVAPPPISGTPAAQNAARPAAPAAGPSTAPRAGPGAPMAGPGARSTQQNRPMNPVTAASAARANAATRPMNVEMARPASGPAAAPGAPRTLANSLFDGDGAPSSPSAVRASSPSMARPPPAPSGMASIAAAMGQAPPPVPVASSPSAATRAPTSSSSGVYANPAHERLPSSGSLRDVSPMRLYFLAASQDLSGLLTLQVPDRALMLHFRKGSPDLVESTHGDDALATFLLKQKLVGLEQLGQAQKEGARFGGELLPALFGLGLLNPNAAIDALNQRIGGLIAQALLSTDGSFTFQAVELSPQKAMPPGNRWQVYTEQLRKVPAMEVRARLHQALDFPVMKSTGPIAVADMRLTPQEARAYASFDGTRTLNHFLQGPPAEAEHALKAAFILQPCELVSFAGTVVKTQAPAPHAAAPPPPRAPAPNPQASAPNPQASAPPPRAPAAVPGNHVPGNPMTAAGPRTPAYPGAPMPGTEPAPAPGPARPTVSPAAAAAAAAPRLIITAPGAAPAPTAPAMPTAAPPPPRLVVAPPAANAPPRPAAPAAAAAPNFGAELKRLTELAEAMKKQNHFEVLALTKEAPPNAVKVAYLKAARDFHPDTVPQGAPEALAKLKADIFARIGDANRTLSDEKLRKDYVEALEYGGSGEKVDVGKLLQAEEFFQKGRILVQARKFPEAVKMLSDAIAGNPDEAEFYAWRGWATFFTMPDKKQSHPEAMKDIINCLKRNPKIAAAHYFQGAMLKILGDGAGAMKHFRETVALDPKHIDAQRELRTKK